MGGDTFTLDLDNGEAVQVAPDPVTGGVELVVSTAYGTGSVVLTASGAHAVIVAMLERLDV